jgi:hypothetical protein
MDSDLDVIIGGSVGVLAGFFLGIVHMAATRQRANRCYAEQRTREARFEIDV